MRQTSVHRVPLKDFDAELFLPRDMTRREAERICRVIKTLAQAAYLKPKSEVKP